MKALSGGPVGGGGPDGPTARRSAAEGQAFDSQLARAGRAERKAIKKLLKSIGAVPTVPGRGGGEAPTEDEAQDA